MTLWMLFALLLVAMVAASMVPTRTPPPQVIVVHMAEPPVGTSSGCFPLLLLVGAVIIAVAFF